MFMLRSTHQALLQAEREHAAAAVQRMREDCDRLLGVERAEVRRLTDKLLDFANPKPGANPNWTPMPGSSIDPKVLAAIAERAPRGSALWADLEQYAVLQLGAGETADHVANSILDGGTLGDSLAFQGLS